ncbi:MAG TPA: hypothetical protein VNA25_19495 [Phycisphaerae bacterium]|nr:hypothetical protein [Phycisphaerae bacterium]
MPALKEDGQRFGKADGKWVGDGLVIPPNDGVPGTIFHRQVLKAPVGSNDAGYATLAVTAVQPGEEITVPYKLVPDGTCRVGVVRFTAAPPAGDFIEIHGEDGYGATQSETVPVLSDFAFGDLAYKAVTKLVWRGASAYTGTLEVGWSKQIGLRFPIVSPQDVIYAEYQETPGSVPIPVSTSQIEVNYFASGSRGLWSPFSPNLNGIRNFTILYRPSKVHTVEAVPLGETAADVFQADYESGGN